MSWTIRVRGSRKEVDIRPYQARWTEKRDGRSWEIVVKGGSRVEKSREPRDGGAVGNVIALPRSFPRVRGNQENNEWGRCGTGSQRTEGGLSGPYRHFSLVQTFQENKRQLWNAFTSKYTHYDTPIINFQEQKYFIYSFPHFYFYNILTPH